MQAALPDRVGPRRRLTRPTALDTAYAEIRAIQEAARKRGAIKVPLWPMIILRSPKGWTGPKEVDGLPIEGTFRAHQVPLATVRESPPTSSFSKSG